jgi:hypothetical protein
MQPSEQLPKTPALVDTIVSEQAAVNTDASGTQLASVETYKAPSNFAKSDLNRADVLCVVCVVRYVCVCVFCILCVPCYVMCCARCVKLHDV